MSQWFVSRDGKQQGPVSEEGLLQAIGRGKVRAGDLVWCDTMTEWLPVSGVPALAAALPEEAPATSVAAAEASASSASYSQQAQSESSSSAYAQPQQIGYQGGYTGPVQLTERTIALFNETRPWVRLVSIMLFIFIGIGGLIALAPLIGAIVALSSNSQAGTTGGGAMLLVALVQIVMLSLYLFPAVFLWRYGARIADLVRLRREDMAEAAVAAQKSFWKFVGILLLVMIALWLLMVAAFLFIGFGAMSGAGSKGAF